MKFFLVAIIIFLAIGNSTGQLNHTIYNTVLWEVKDTQNQTTSYILGTSYALGSKFFHSMSSAYKKLKQSDLILLQATGEDANIWKNSAKREDNPEWKKLLSKNEWQFINEKLDNQPFQKLRFHELDLCLSLEYLRDICEGCSTKDDVRCMNDYIEELGGFLNIPTQGLEEGNDHFKQLREQYVPGNLQENQVRRLKSLIKALKFNDEILGDECDLVFEYKDMELPYAFSEPCPNTTPIIANTNKEWADILPQHLSQHSCFIAISWYHLRYECGLIMQLMKKGYVVTPVDLWE